MKIGLISDSHNESEMLKRVAIVFKSLGIKTIIHCGDVTDAKELNLLKGFKVFLVYGNSDLDQFSLAQKIEQFDNESQCGKFLKLIICEKHIFIIHGDDFRKIDDIAHSNYYDYIFCGHSHMIRDEMIGKTRIINPGALAGKYGRQRAFAVIDLETDRLDRFFED